jgi:hypothetical protein
VKLLRFGVLRVGIGEERTAAVAEGSEDMGQTQKQQQMPRSGLRYAWFWPVQPTRFVKVIRILIRRFRSNYVNPDGGWQVGSTRYRRA